MKDRPELAARLCVIANEADHVECEQGRDRPIYYGPYHEVGLLAVHDDAIRSERKRCLELVEQGVDEGPVLCTERDCIIEAIKRGNGTFKGEQDVVSGARYRAIRDRLRAAEAILDQIPKCTVTIGGHTLSKMLSKYWKDHSRED